jgi:endonuclease YncB( thermonuclease family)
MKNCLITNAFLISLLLLLPTLSLAADWKVTRVYDGDTIHVSDNKYSVKVKLVGIDAPEIDRKKREQGQPFSQQSKKYLAGLILNKSVDIRAYELDVDNQILGILYFRGRNINLHMVKAGLAEVNRGNPPDGFDTEPYWQAEKKAREAKMGMWTLGDKYVSPKDWRDMQKSKPLK